MAYVTDFNKEPQAKGLFSSIIRMFDALCKAAYVARGMDARLAEIERLRALSDAELAAMKLRRDDIPQYVLRDIIHV